MENLRKRSSPPKIAEWLLKRIFPDYGDHTSAGDFEEIFHSIAESKSGLVAQLWYWFQLILSLKSFILGKIYWSIIMLGSYIKIAFRRIKREKGYYFITITGLSIGMACCILIFVYINHELSYDNYHKDVDRIYRIPTIVKSGSQEKPFARGLTPLIPALQKNFPEVESAARFHYLRTSNVKVEYKDRVFKEETLMLADSELFSVLTIPFLSGNSSTALDRPRTIVITEEIANKIFRREDPLGKTLKVNDSDYEITGVIKNPPENTHLKYDLILSLKTMEKRMNMDNWGWTGFYSYVKLLPNINPLDFERKIRKIAHNYLGEALDKAGIEFISFMQPLRDIHLHSKLNREIKPPGNSIYIYIFSVVGILVLIVACINFMNLTTARSLERAKEIGVRKVWGAHRSQVVRQIFGEFFLVIIIALLMAIFLIILILPNFNELAGKNFTSSYFLQPVNIILFVSIVLFVGLAAGSYPAFLLSSVRPVWIFQKHSRAGLGGKLVRRVLVVWQFAISIALIICTLTIYQQIDYMKNEYLGFDIEQKLIVPAYMGDKFETIKNEFLSHPSITGAAASAYVPGRITNSLITNLVGSEDTRGQTMLYNFVDYDFIPEYGIEVIAGRSFQREISTDVEKTFILNEAAVKDFGLGSPDEAIDRQLQRGSTVGSIIGVVKDFHIKGLQSKIQPHILQLTTQAFSLLNLTISTQNIGDTIDFIKKKWEELHLGGIFSYYFLDEDFNRQYDSEVRAGQLFSIFSVLGIFIAVLGLFGLSLFITEQRTKEIGIRKVLGASVTGLILLLSKEFTKWVLVANIIAWPVAYFYMKNWLQNFAYRTNIELWIFILSGVFALILALFTVSFQAVKAALANPVDSLRYE